jgi:hypothetical protein
MKESFVLYKSFYEPTKNLCIEDKASLYDAIFQYQIEGIEPPNTSRIYMAFLFFKNQFRLDEEKYSKVVERNKSNGSKGGRPSLNSKPKITNEIPNNPMGFEEPKKADNDNDNEKDFIDNSNFLNTEGKDNGQYSFGVVVEKPKKNKKSLLTKISFNDSLIFDKVNFKNRFPNWSKEKLIHYYNSALSYSVEGNKYVDWGMAINNWASRDENKGMKFKEDASLQETETERKIREFKARGF